MAVPAQYRNRAIAEAFAAQGVHDLLEGCAKASFLEDLPRKQTARFQTGCQGLEKNIVSTLIFAHQDMENYLVLDRCL